MKCLEHMKHDLARGELRNHPEAYGPHLQKSMLFPGPGDRRLQGVALGSNNWPPIVSISSNCCLAMNIYQGKKTCENPNSRNELQYKPSAPKTEPSIKSKSAEQKTKASFRTSIWGLKNVWWNLKFQIFTSKYRVTFLKPLNLYVRPVSGTCMRNLLTLMWNYCLFLGLQNCTSI